MPIIGPIDPQYEKLIAFMMKEKGLTRDQVLQHLDDLVARKFGKRIEWGMSRAAGDELIAVRKEEMAPEEVKLAEEEIGFTHKELPCSFCGAICLVHTNVEVRDDDAVRCNRCVDVEIAAERAAVKPSAQDWRL